MRSRISIGALALMLSSCTHLGRKPAAVIAHDPVARDLETGTLEVFTKLGFGHGCSVGDDGHTWVITSGHIVDPHPLDRDAPYLAASWSDHLGNAGLADPIGADRYRDLAVLKVRSGTPGRIFPLASKMPQRGQDIWLLNYDYSSRMTALGPLVLRTRVVRIIAGHVITEQEPTPGASGGCAVVLQDGRVVVLGLSSWSIPVGKEDARIGVIVGSWVDWLGVNRVWAEDEAEERVRKNPKQ